MLTFQQILKTKSGSQRRLKLAIAAGIAVAGFLVLVLPGLQKMPGVNRSIRSSTGLLELKQKKADNIDVLAERCEKHELEWDRLLSYMLTEQEHESFSEKLSQLATTAGLTVHRIQPSARQAVPPVTKEQKLLLERSPVLMSLSGNYANVVAFVTKLSRTGKLLNVSAIKIESNDKTDEDLQIELTVTAYSVKEVQSAQT